MKITGSLRKVTLNKRKYLCGTWVAQLAKHTALDFGLGHHLRVVRSSPPSGPHLVVVCLRFSSFPFAALHTLSLKKINKYFLKIRKYLLLSQWNSTIIVKAWISHPNPTMMRNSNRTFSFPVLAETYQRWYKWNSLF